jgi:hypothetical protein
MLAYGAMKTLEYFTNDFTGFIVKNSRNTTAFFPGKEADFNMAFGFSKKEIPADIGYWEVTHVKRHWRTRKMHSMKDKQGPPFTYTKCNFEKEFKEINHFEKKIMKNLHCTDIFKKTAL